MSTVTSKDGTKIAYDQVGAGPAIIMVAGATAFRASDPKAAQLAGLLAPHFTVINFDRRGRGKSNDTLPYMPEREYEDIEALIDAAGGSAFVYGISSGAVLSLRAAASGLPIKKLAVYEPPFIIDAGRPPVPDDYIEQLDALLAEGKRGDMAALFLVHAVGMPPEYVEPMRNEPFWPGMEAVAPTLPYDARQMADTMRGNPLAAAPWNAIKIPTIVIDGGASPDWMHHSAEALAGILPSSQRRTLDEQTHDVDPVVLAPVLDAFFSE